MGKKENTIQAIYKNDIKIIVQRTTKTLQKRKSIEKNQQKRTQIENEIIILLIDFSI